MFILAKIGSPPSIFTYLKEDVPLCASFMFGTTMIMKYITKGKKSGPIRKETYNKTGYGVSVDQPQPA